MPAVHAVAFLEFQVHPPDAVTFGPVIEIMQRVLDVVTGPDRIGRRTSPFHPVIEGEIRRVVDAVLLLQRRADDAAATAGNCGGPTAFTRLFQNDGFAARASDFDSRRNPCASPAYDHNIGLQT